jgi:hypothetical protein
MMTDQFRSKHLSLFDHQIDAANQLKTGSILCGGVGSGKTLTAIAYYFVIECGGKFDKETGPSYMTSPKDLFIITTAAKRDTLDWERECSHFSLSRDPNADGVRITVDSWNNIRKYIDVENSFFIFDEQRIVGSGTWVKSFLKIAKKNKWILLSATPGDTWMDYIPVFIANGFYKNRTEFLRTHVVYNTFTKFPKVDHYVEEQKLRRLKAEILVHMDYVKPTESIHEYIKVGYDVIKFDLAKNKRWNPFTNKPIKDVSEHCNILRKVVNSNPERLEKIKELIIKHRKIIVFYNFNYELDMLRTLKDLYTVAEYNGHKHEGLPQTESWLYLVQYCSGSEGWNCVETNAIIFYSLNYSYRVMIQAAGRIDRLNTPFAKLYYYTFISGSSIDMAISKALRTKKNFNEKTYIRNSGFA